MAPVFPSSLIKLKRNNNGITSVSLVLPVLSVLSEAEVPKW